MIKMLKNISAERLIRSNKFFNDIGLKLEDIYEHGKDYTIHLTWDGGEESILVTVPIINEINT
jgi:hypothetical protein